MWAYEFIIVLLHSGKVWREKVWVIHSFQAAKGLLLVITTLDGFSL